ncbi:MAG: CotH kinase family protein [Cyclobacteriaceae bacterium]
MMNLRFLSLFIMLPLIGQSQLKINELMTNNVSYLMDDAYNFSMWVELYNSSATQTINLSDYYFTDERSDPTKWQPASGTVSPQGFEILYFERDERAGHASFKIDPEGGELFIYSAQELVDQVEYPEQFRNISFGRKTDGGEEWVFFEEPSPASSNTNKLFAALRCSNPVFSLKGGFYSGSQSLTFLDIPAGTAIYYTTDNTEPNKSATLLQAGETITMSSTKVVRAKAYQEGQLSSDVISATFFINERKPDLRVVSISTDQRFLTNDTIGIYCDGTNGIIGNLQKTPKNFNQDWDRPVNFEFFDEEGIPQLNQELDIRIVGGGSRESALKSISISPKRKFYENQLKYDFFKSTKPGHKYKDIMMRNSGNDFKRTMMKDAFIQSLIVNRMEVDYQAYEPAVIYINGEYFGIENMRERANKDFAYSNFGYDKDEVKLIEATYKGVDSHNDIPTDATFNELSSFLKRNPMSDPANYAQAKEMIDVEELVNYLILETFTANVDWPYNNVKMWKPIENGKWRWILMDVEYSYSMGRVDHNTVTFALGENTKSMIGGYSSAPEWSVVVFAELIKNAEFRDMFIDRYAIHLSTTFKPERTIHFVDSMSARISNEIPYHLARFNIADNFEKDLKIFRDFSTQRPANVLKHLSERFLNNASTATIHLSADINGASYTLNGQMINDTEAEISYFKGRDLAMAANPIMGYQFKHWLVDNQVVEQAVYSGVMDADLELKAIYEIDANQVKIPVFINEVVSSNQIITDEYDETDDYIELYNDGSEAIDIAGWFVTDDITYKRKAQIPEGNGVKTTIPSKGTLVLWADGTPEQGPLHLDFKLSKAGESIGLYRPFSAIEVQTVDEVTVPILDSNMSYARVPDGSSTWAIQQPTFNKSNLSLDPLAFEAENIFHIQPTLVNDAFHIHNALAKEVKVIGLNGQVYFSSKCKSADELIDISHLPKGLYIVAIGQFATRIVKE